MPGHNRRSGLRKPHTQLVRRILVGAHEDERRILLEDVKALVRAGAEYALSTVHTLRNDHGVALPMLIPKWDLVTIEKPTPADTIDAFSGNQSEIRITLHLDQFEDNTETIKLEDLGISHLVGISITESEPLWQSEDKGAMTAQIRTLPSNLPFLLHDIFIDMAMIHAKSCPWTNMKELLSSEIIAAQKANFVKSEGLTGSFPYGLPADNCRYFPLAAFAQRIEQRKFDSSSYVEIWAKFAGFVQKEEKVPLKTQRSDLPELVLRSHKNCGQISIRKLENEIAKLQAGHYCFYFHIRKSNTLSKIAELRTFFEIRPTEYRAQVWIIHPREKHSRMAAKFLHEHFISVLPFYVGD